MTMNDDELTVYWSRKYCGKPHGLGLGGVIRGAIDWVRSETDSRITELESQLREAREELKDMKIIAEKCLDPEFMEFMSRDVIVASTVKKLKVAEAELADLKKLQAACHEEHVRTENELAVVRRVADGERAELARAREENRGLREALGDAMTDNDNEPWFRLWCKEVLALSPRTEGKEGK